MSYLNMPKGGVPDFTKATLSLWFRVPQASLVACALAPRSTKLDTIIPFVTFGAPFTKPFIDQQKQTWTTYKMYDAFVDGLVIANVPVISYTPVSTGDVYIDPSYLGISVSNNQTVRVQGNFQTDAIPTFGGEWVVSGCTVPQPEQSPVTTTWALHSAPRGPQAYYFSLPNADGNNFADRWHHLLVSCDLSGLVSTNSSGATIAEGVTSYNRMWVALDDVNVNGYDAFPNFVGGSDLNAVITDDSYNAAGALSPPYTLPGTEFQATIYTDSQGHTHIVSGRVPNQNTGTSNVPVTCSLPPGPVPTSGQPFGFPATADQVDQIYRVELAEFQMWTGIALDTSIEDNRRAFINKDGKPVSPTMKATGDNPQSGSIEFMGSPPDVMLHKSGNWKAGRNTGSSGVDDNGQNIPDGQFEPTGKIKVYEPDPSLHGPQSPGQKP